MPTCAPTSLVAAAPPSLSGARGLKANKPGSRRAGVGSRGARRGEGGSAPERRWEEPHRSGGAGEQVGGATLEPRIDWEHPWEEESASGSEAARARRARRALWLRLAR